MIDRSRSCFKIIAMVLRNRAATSSSSSGELVIGVALLGMAKKRGGRKTPREILRVKCKGEVVDFLEIGARYHGVGVTTYVQWMLERALLDEVHYYGWNASRPLGFDRQPAASPLEHEEFIHLNKSARRRARQQPGSDSSDDLGH
jgi:hypothetical protein